MPDSPKKKVRIAVTLPKYDVGGGAEFYAGELTGLLSRNEFLEFHVFANRFRNASSRIRCHKVAVMTFPKFLTTLSFAYFARKEIRKGSFDLIHSHDRTFEADIFTMHGIPHRIWVSEVRKKKFLSLFDRATVWTERRLVRGGGCKKFLAVSALTRDLFLREYPEINPGKIEIVHPGVDVNAFQNADRILSRKSLEKEFGVLPEERVILFVSMNFDIKGLDSVLRGLARLKSLKPDQKWRLLVIGKGEAKKYAHRAASLGIRDRTVFPGVFKKGRLNEIYPGCDIFVMPSKFDTFGMTVLEAMAASLPVLISSNVGAKDLVTQGVNGFIMENPGDQDGFAEKIESLMDEDTRIKMGQAAFQTAKIHTWDAVAEKMESIYRGVLEQRAREK